MSKIERNVPFSRHQVYDMNEKLSFKMCVKYCCFTLWFRYFLDVLYTILSQSAGTELQ